MQRQDDNKEILIHQNEQQNQQNQQQPRQYHIVGYLTLQLTKTQYTYMTEVYKAKKLQPPIERQTKIQSKRSNFEQLFGIGKETKFKQKLSMQSLQQSLINCVCQTSQQKFSLAKSSFKQQINDKYIKSLKLQMLWKANFTNLKTLDLSNSNLFSIQGLTFCNIHHLKELKLQNNKITSISILYKAKLDEIQNLSFYNNPLNSIQKLSRFHCTNIGMLQIDRKITMMQFLFGGTDNPTYTPVQIIDILIKTQFILKEKNNKELSQNKEFSLNFKNRIQPSWYQIMMYRINSKMKIYSGDSQYWRGGRQNGNQGLQ